MTTSYGLPEILPSWLALTILALLVVLATARLSRFLTTDSLGQWTVVEPLEKWALPYEMLKRQARREALKVMFAKVESGELDYSPGQNALLLKWSEELEDEERPMSWRSKLVSGLQCPFCVGFWIGAVLTVLTILLSPLAGVGTVWAAMLAVLALNYVVGHVSARLD